MPQAAVRAGGNAGETLIISLAGRLAVDMWQCLGSTRSRAMLLQLPSCLARAVQVEYHVAATQPEA